MYGLDAPGRIVGLYRAVLIEAASPQGLYTYLNAAVLLRLWALLWLPEYRTEPGALADMRHRFAQWCQELLAAGTS